MTKEEFLLKANQNISEDFNSRISKNIQNIKDVAIFDTHCHIFDIQCLPVGYFILRFLTSKALNLLFSRTSVLDSEKDEFDLFVIENNSLVGIDEFDLYENLKSGVDYTFDQVNEDLNKAIGFLDDYDSILVEREKRTLISKRLSDLRFIKKILINYKTNESVLDSYLSNFAIKNISQFTDRPFITSILMMDCQPGWEFKPQKKSISEQIEEILGLTEKYANSDTPILPFFAVDPRRMSHCGPQDNNQYLFDLFLKAFPKSGPSFYGVKIYPSLGYLPSDYRLTEIFEICEKKNIPVLSHCGASLVGTFEKKTSDKLRLTDNFDQNSNVEIEFQNRREMGDFLNQPEHWDIVLNRFPKLKLNIAHFGSEVTWDDSTPNIIKAVKTNKPQYKQFSTTNRKDTIIRLIKTNLTVFSDFSFNIAIKETYLNYRLLLDSDPEIVSKTMFGTDFWVVLAKTMGFKADLIPQQQDFFNYFEPYKKSLFETVPRSYLFGLDYEPSVPSSEEPVLITKK